MSLLGRGRAALRTSALLSLSGAMAAALAVEERTRGVEWPRREAYVQRWARTCLRILGVEVVVRGGVPPRTGRPRVVVANHRSTLDVFVLLATFGGHLLAKGEMEHWPITGVLATMAGTLFVDRDDPRSGAAAIRAMKERLAAGEIVAVFPEGTTFDDDEVRPFHAGAFAAISRVRGEVLPVGIAYGSRDGHYRDEPIGAHWARAAGARKTRVVVEVGSIVPAGKSIGGLADECRAAVQAAVHRARTG